MDDELRAGALVRYPLERGLSSPAPDLRYGRAREAVLAFFHASRNEHEYVIDTTRLEPETRREVLPEEWEYLLDQPLTRLREPDALGSPETEPGELDASAGESPTVDGFTRAEAIGLALQTSEGLTAEATVAALNAVEDLYHPDVPEQRPSRETLRDAIATAQENHRA